MEQRFWGVVPIERAAAFLWFTEGSRYRALIHQFKYHGQWYLAENMGRWFASELKVGDFLEGVELIVPVPLHWRRRIMRGYNQSEHIAHGISRATGIPCCFSAVKRTVHNPPQAGMKYINRWDNINNIFSVPHPERLIGRHILLVDDVFTSGATLLALATQIHRACNGNVKISVATLAASSHLVL